MLKKIENIYVQEKNKLLNYIKRRTENIEEAEDIFQNVFYKAILYANSLESIDNLIGWLYTVAKNKIIDNYRKKSRKNISLQVLNENEFIENIFNATEKIENDILFDNIIDLIDKLPEKQNLFKLR